MSVTLSGAKILVTGVTGQIGRPLAAFLAKENDVWGVARFRQDGAAESVAGLGITPVALELSRGDYRVLPDDFTHVVHLAAFMGPGLDFDKATRITAEGTGLLLHHCRKAKAALVMSTHSVYRPHEDPWHAYNESDPLGDAGSEHSPTYSMSKIGEEAVARSCARTLGLPVLIARMNACYGPGGGLPAYQLDAVVEGSPVVARWEPSPYSLIHQDDVNTQAAALMEAASVPATIVNWAGDEPATVREWCSYAASLAGLAAEVSVEERPASQRGAVADTGRRRAITGLCKVGWREGIRETLIARHPGLVKEMTA